MYRIDFAANVDPPKIQGFFRASLAPFVFLILEDALSDITILETYLDIEREAR